MKRKVKSWILGGLAIFCLTGMGCEQCLIWDFNTSFSNVQEKFFAEGDYTYIADTAIADFNRDSVVDIAIGYQSGKSKSPFAILTGRKDSSSQVLPMPTIHEKTFAMAPGIFYAETAQLRAIDINGDNFPDLVWMGQYPYKKGGAANIATFINNGVDSTGKLSFTLKQSFSTTATLNFATGDLVGDALPDLALTTDNSTLTIYRNEAGTFVANKTLPILNGGFVVIEDFNHDKLHDLAIISGLPGVKGQTLRYWLGQAGENLSPEKLSACANCDGRLRSVASFDKTGQGLRSIIAISDSSYSSSYAIYEGLNSPAFNFANAQQINMNLRAADRVAAADVNKDNISEIFITAAATTTNTGGDNLAALSFGRQPGITYKNFGFQLMGGLALGDLNGDGKTDLVVGEYINEWNPEWTIQKTAIRTSIDLSSCTCSVKDDVQSGSSCTVQGKDS